MPTHHHTPRPRTLIAACVGLGLRTSVVVAWLLAAFVPIPAHWVVGGPRGIVGAFVRWNRPWKITELPCVGVVDARWTDLNITDAGGDPSAVVIAERSRFAELIEMYPRTVARDAPRSWGTFARSSPPAAPINCGSDSAFGWPLVCLWYQVVGTLTLPPTGITFENQSLHGGALLRGQASCLL